MPQQDTDSISRDRIIQEIDTNFFVEAGAGSGKTTMLVNRMVAMVEAGKDISKICAITFTKAAAKEFYERFQKILSERSDPNYPWNDEGYAGQLPKPTAVTREYCRKALQDIDLCFMGTIDSFCSMVLSEHPTEAGIPSDLKLMSDNDLEDYYSTTFRKIRNGDFGDEMAKSANNFCAYYWYPQEAFVYGMKMLMDKRNADFVVEGESVELNDNFDKDFENDKIKLQKTLDLLIQHPEFVHSTKDSNNAYEKINDIQTEISKKWSKNFLGILWNLNGLKKLVVEREAFENYPEFSFFIPATKTAVSYKFPYWEKDGLYNKLQQIQYASSMHFLLKCIPYIEEKMKSNGMMTFFDYLYYLRNMLKDDAEKSGQLIKHIYDRHSYFLIDEFQDTNPMQAEIFFYLTAEKPQADWQACNPKAGSLFMVGDPKQSIYRFRGADVSSYLNVKELFKSNAGDVLELTKNFRSANRMLDGFNRIFGKLLREETDDQSKFSEIPLNENQDKGIFEGRYHYEAFCGDECEEPPAEYDSVQITKIIKSIVGNDKLKTQDKDENDKPILRNLKYSDIMIIVDKKSKIPGIVNCLYQNKIPTRTEGSISFDCNTALLRIFSCFKAVVNSGNKNALYNALISFEVTDEELYEYVVKRNKICHQSLNDKNEDIDKWLNRDDIVKFKDFANKATKLTPSALFIEIMDSLKIYQGVPAENLEEVFYALELLKNAQNTNLVVTYNDAVEFLRKLIDGESEIERCLSLKETDDAVHIANLHKVKGLEAPVVILAGATKTKKINPSSRIEHNVDGIKGFVFKVVKDTGDWYKPTLFETNDFEDQKEDEKRSSEAENDRLLYVAATRARNALIVCDSITNRGKSSKWKPILDECKHDVFEVDSIKNYIPQTKQDEEGYKIEASKLYNETDTVLDSEDQTDGESVVIRKPEQPTYTTSSPSKIDANKPDIIDDSEVRKINRVPIRPTVRGTMVHKFMEMLISSNNSYNVDAAIDQIVTEYLDKRTLDEYDGIKMLKQVYKTLIEGGYAQSNGAPQDILNILLNADEVYCEVPFSFKTDAANFVASSDNDADPDSTLCSGIMDVIYSKDDKWHIVDYKTNKDGSNLDEEYKEQLEAYKTAFKLLTGHDADAHTYHIDVQIK